jgi:hypothetical protein
LVKTSRVNGLESTSHLPFFYSNIWKYLFS